MKFWYNPRATDKMADYTYLGSSIDSPEMPMDPESPLTHDVIGGINNLFKIEHTQRIRIDNMPDDQLEINDMYAAEVLPSIRGGQISGH
jgi:hypothetical protein